MERRHLLLTKEELDLTISLLRFRVMLAHKVVDALLSKETNWKYTNLYRGKGVSC